MKGLKEKPRTAAGPHFDAIRTAEGHVVCLPGHCGDLLAPFKFAEIALGYPNGDGLVAVGSV